jgi:hypothetical protein
MCLNVSQSVLKGLNVSQVVSSCLKVSQCVSMCLNVFQCVSMCLKVYLLIPKWAKTLLGNGESPNGNFFVGLRVSRWGLPVWKRGL